MADDLGLGIGFFQVFEQEPEGGLLFWSASIGIVAFVVHTANVANTDGVLVVVLDMGTGILLGTAGMNRSILIDDPVVAAAGPAFGLVEVVEVFDSHLLTDFRVGAVNDDPLDVLHRKKFLFIHRVKDLENSPMRSTALHGDCSQNRRNDGCNEFQDFCDCCPIYFHHGFKWINS